MTAIADIRLDALEEAAYRNGVQAVRLGGRRVLYVRWATVEVDEWLHCWRYFLWTAPDGYAELSRAKAEKLL